MKLQNPFEKAPAPTVPEVLLWLAIAVAAFHAAYLSPLASGLVIVYLFALLQLARAEKWRLAFYPAFAVGLLIGFLRLGFFYTIFGGGAAALWIVYAFWIGLFVALARLCLRHQPKWGWPVIPFAWVGLEYFRSELYYLRFSWLSPGYALADFADRMPFSCVGVYGAGFVLTMAACCAVLVWQRRRIAGLGALGVGVAAVGLVGKAPVMHQASSASVHPKVIHMAGIQMEFPTEKEVLVRLTELARKQPETELIVLSEYTFTEPVPEKVKEWCRTHRRYLIVGGEDPLPGGNYYNTAFVIGPTGEIVFRQVKGVPIQFFKDGRPAPEQKLWDSPWGKIGICICYDLSYTRVTDPLIRLGAQALIVPTMDVMDWGVRQHKLHARVAPIRAAEYGIPIFRVASSGVSQWVERTGTVLQQAPCPGDGAVLFGELELAAPGRLPWDRHLAPFAAGLTAAIAAALLAGRFYRRGRRRAGLPPNRKQPGEPVISTL